MLSVAFDCLLKCFYSNLVNLKIILVTRPRAYINYKQLFFLKNWFFKLWSFRHAKCLRFTYPSCTLFSPLLQTFHLTAHAFMTYTKVWTVLQSSAYKEYFTKCKTGARNISWGIWILGVFCFKLFVYSVLLIKAKEIMINKLCNLNNFLSSLLEQVNHT